MSYRSRIWTIAFVIALFFTGAHANAAEEKIEKFGAWFYQCKTLEIGDVCALRHVQLFKDKNPALTLTIVDPNSTEGLRIHFKVPLGVFLPAGLRVSVDSGEQRVFPYLDCIQTGCLGIIGLRKEGRKALKAGNKMQIEYAHQRGQKKITLDVPLADFTAGLTRLSKANKRLQKKAPGKKTATAVTPKRVTPKVVPADVVTPEVATPAPATPKAVTPTVAAPATVAEQASEPEAASEEEAEAEAEKSGGSWFKRLFSGGTETDDDDTSEEE